MSEKSGQTAILNNLIFENSEKIPNGLYLELMNQTKKIFDEIEEIKKIKKEDDNHYLNFILVKTPRTYLLNLISRQSNKTLTLWDRAPYFINRVSEGTILRLLSLKNHFLFMKIIKINRKSLRYDLIKFKIDFMKPPHERKTPKIRKNILLNFDYGRGNLEHNKFYILDEDIEETNKIYEELKLLTSSYVETNFIIKEDLDHKI